MRTANLLPRPLPLPTGPIVYATGPTGEVLTLFLVTVSDRRTAVLMAPTATDAIEDFYCIWPEDGRSIENAIPLTQAEAEGLAANLQDFYVDANRPLTVGRDQGDGTTTLSELLVRFRQMEGGPATAPATEGEPVLCPACANTFGAAAESLQHLGFENRWAAMCPFCYTRLLLMRYQGNTESLDGDHFRAVLFEHPESTKIRAESGSGGGDIRLVKQDRPKKGEEADATAA